MMNQYPTRLNRASQYVEKKQHGSDMLPFDIYGTVMPALYSSYPMHCHKEVEIILAEEGSCVYSVENEDFTLTEGDIMVIMPWSLHTFHVIDENTSFVATTVLASLSIINSEAMDICSYRYFTPMLNGQSQSCCVVRRDSPHHDELWDLAYELCEVFIQKEKFFEINLKSLLSRLFYLLLKYGCLTVMDADEAKLDDDLAAIRELIAYISENYREHITLESLAQISNLSESKLSRTFRRVTGMSCIDYVIEHRLLTSLDMLLSTGKSVLEIAYDSGFNNISYFNRMFKKRFNVTPTEIRRRNSKENSEGAR